MTRNNYFDIAKAFISILFACLFVITPSQAKPQSDNEQNCARAAKYLVPVKPKNYQSTCSRTVRVPTGKTTCRIIRHNRNGPVSECVQEKAYQTENYICLKKADANIEKRKSHFAECVQKRCKHAFGNIFCDIDRTEKMAQTQDSEGMFIMATLAFGGLTDHQKNVEGYKWLLLSGFPKGFDLSISPALEFHFYLILQSLKGIDYENFVLSMQNAEVDVSELIEAGKDPNEWRELPDGGLCIITGGLPGDLSMFKQGYMKFCLTAEERRFAREKAALWTEKYGQKPER